MRRQLLIDSDAEEVPQRGAGGFDRTGADVSIHVLHELAGKQVDDGCELLLGQSQSFEELVGEAGDVAGAPAVVSADRWRCFLFVDEQVRPGTGEESCDDF